MQTNSDERNIKYNYKGTINIAKYKRDERREERKKKC